jgi:trk/ktr system potassium uptake protein
VSRYSAVHFAVRFQAVASLLSRLYGLLGLLTLVPATVAYATGSALSASIYLAIAGALGVAALLGRRLGRIRRVQRNEAATVVSLLFVSASLLMALPMMSFGIPFMDAWFEAASGITTTGLSTLDLADKPTAFLFGRAWLQWIGGVGVVVLALAMIVSPGYTAKSLGFSAAETGDAVGGSRAHARRVVMIYLSVTLIGIAALWLTGASPRDAVLYCLAAVSTGGFAPYADSLASRSPLQIGIVDALCIAGAVSFHVYYRSTLALRRGKPLDSQFYALLAAIGVGSLLVAAIAASTDAHLAWQDIVSLVISAQTTAGFATTSVTALPAWLLIVLCALMFVGGGIGSTAGGVKLGRILFVAAWARMYLVRTGLAPNVHTVVRVSGRKVSHSDLEDVLAVIGCFSVVLLASWLVFVAHGYPALPALFEVTSALGTVGLSAGLTDATLPATLKFVLCADMLFGRVEVVALLLVLLPQTWIGMRHGPDYGKRP